MDTKENGQVVRMVRHHLEKLPSFALPPSFSTRWFRKGDEETWYRLQTETEKHIPISRDLFQKEFGADAEELGKRMCFLLDESGREIGTASAWYDNAYQGEPYGRIHWVAITPAMQGKGLSKSLLSAACLRLKDLGHGKAYLVTDTRRIAAIHVYLQFGFEPVIDNEQDWRAWSSWGNLNAAGLAENIRTK
jgi:GNAT superfamily N-acetyltransferase